MSLKEKTAIIELTNKKIVFYSRDISEGIIAAGVWHLVANSKDFLQLKHS